MPIPYPSTGIVIHRPKRLQMASAKRLVEVQLHILAPTHQSRGMAPAANFLAGADGGATTSGSHRIRQSLLTYVTCG